MFVLNAKTYLVDADDSEEEESDRESIEEDTSTSSRGFTLCYNHWIKVWFSWGWLPKFPHCSWTLEITKRPPEKEVWH